ncbi:hypothetical protein AVEN_241084-1 [Araneus ventricosus]|uniref:Uncharacterized protein n=1 Tax=Araneus ventricosus TaxID=182803 RepID=A0A4Y2LPU4_ARAVE|nr:hypothetical protein AVEN_241084-1 [Araneus ventricosus]
MSPKLHPLESYQIAFINAKSFKEKLNLIATLEANVSRPKSQSLRNTYKDVISFMNNQILPAARQNGDGHLKPIHPSGCSGSGYSTSSDSDYELFHEVKNTKKKLYYHVRSEALQKKIKSIPIDLENSYESLPSAEDLDVDDDPSNMQVEHSLEKKSNSPFTSKASSINSQKDADATPTPKLPLKIDVPPIIIDDPLSASAIMKTLSDLCETKIMGKILPGNKLKLYPASTEHHRQVQKHIKATSLKSHTFPLQEEKLLKVVIRGLTRNMEIDKIY